MKDKGRCPCTSKMTVRVDNDLRDKLKFVASRHGTSMTDYVVTMIENQINKEFADLVRKIGVSK